MGKRAVSEREHAAAVLTVVIPTRNRRERLESALASIHADSKRPGAPAIEIVVVDDGSTDGTGEWLARREARARAGAARCIRLDPGRGPAAARNAGARAALAPTLLFLADDLRIAPGLLAAHAAAGGKRAILGEIRWDPSLRITPFMRFVEEAGIHFDYPAIRREAAAAGGGIPFWRAYASNLSIGREPFLDLGGFDESFPEAAYEDLELAHRFTEAGGRIVFEPRALAWHQSATTVRAYLTWRRRASRWAGLACEKAPPLAPLVLRPAGRGGRPWRRLYANPLVASALEVAASAVDSTLGLPLPRAVYRGLLSYALPRAEDAAAARASSRRMAAGTSMRPGLSAGASIVAARLLFERLAEVASRVRGDCLDLGCGESPYRALFDDGAVRSWMGVDIRPLPGAALPMAVASADHLPFRAGSFDTILAVEVLEHCPDPGAALREAARCLRPGGAIVASVPFFYPPHDLPNDHRRFTADGLAHLLGEAGLALQSIEPVGGVGAVIADTVLKMLGETGLALSEAAARWMRLGPSSAALWGRAAGAALACVCGVGGLTFLGTRRLLGAWIARRPAGWLRGRLARFLADRSSRIAKGYVAVATSS